MPENTKQHYIPKMYLKKFSINNDKKHIGIYVIDKKLYIASGDLGNQAYEDYFYGRDCEIEEMLCVIENFSAPVLNTIYEKNTLPPIPSEEHAILLTFLVSLLGRTKDAGDTFEKMSNKLFKETFKHDDRFKHVIHKYNLKLKNAATFTLGHSLMTYSLLADLKIKILQNETKIPFIISDDPIILYNQFMENKPTLGSSVGLINSGLQIFMPISPAMCLLFYDGDLYNVGSRDNHIVPVRQEKDVFYINGLQFCNAENHLYFNDGIDAVYINEIEKHFRKYLKPDKSGFKQFNPEIKSDEHRAGLLMLYHEDIKINLKCDFIFETQKAREFVFGDRFIHPRNEQLIEIAEQINGRRMDEHESKIFINPNTKIYKEIKPPPNRKFV